MQLAQLAELVTAHLERGRHDRQRLDVVDRAGTAERAVLRGKRRLQARLTATAFERVEQRRLFAADVRAGAGVHVDFDFVVFAERVLAQVALGLRLFDGAPQPLLAQVQLVAHVDVTGVRADRVAADDAALDQRVRIHLHDGAILERAGLAFVGVDHEVVRLLATPWA